MFRRLFPLFVCVSCVWAAERKFDFGEFAENQTPTNFQSAITGRGPLGDWKIITAEVPSALPAFSPDKPVFTKRSVLAQLSTDREIGRAHV